MPKTLTMPIQEMAIHCVTYGLGDQFDLAKFRPAEAWEERRHFPKPKYGLWGSPVDAEWGWKEWCEAEGFRECTEADSFEWELRGRVFVVDSHEDCLKLPWGECPSGFTSGMMRPLDWGWMHENCGALYLTEKGERETRFANDVTLYGYDCECVLALKESVIFPL